MTATPANPPRALVIEDESLLSMLLEDVLTEAGYSVAGCARSLDDARRLAQTLEFDLALVDVNLAGVESFPVADLLRERGIPLLFVTGYGAEILPERFGDTPVLDKPFGRRELEAALHALPGAPPVPGHTRGGG